MNFWHIKQGIAPSKLTLFLICLVYQLAQKVSLGDEWGIPIETGTPVQITKLLPSDCRLVRGFTHAPVDGRTDTLNAAGGISEWSSGGVPAISYAEFNGNNGLHLTLPAGGFDVLQVRGGWKGRVYTNHFSLTDPAPVPAPLVQLDSGYAGVPFPARVSASRLSFFKDEDNAGALADVTLLRVEPGALPPAGPNDLMFGLASTGSPPDVIDIAIVNRFGSGYTARDLATSGSSPLSLAADEFAQLVSPSLDPDWGVETVQLDLDITTIASNAVLYLRIQDPLDPRREVMATDVQVAGTGAYSIRLDLPDQVFLPLEEDWAATPRLEPPVSPPPVIWLSLASDAAVTFQDIQVTLSRTARSNALAEAGDRRAFLLKGLFSNMSEPRPWMHLSEGQPVRDQIATNPNIAPYTNALVELLETVEIAKLLLPTNNVVGEYHDWLYQQLDRNLPSPAPILPADPGAPEWARLIQYSWRQMASNATWWLDNRLVDNGELGGGYGDDTDMYQTWQCLPWIESEPLGARLRAASELLTDLVLTNHLEEGINKTTTDGLHAYEEGVNQLALNAWWNYGDPVHFERVMESAKSVGNLMVETDDGRFHFGGDSIGIDQARNGYASIANSPGVFNWAPVRFMLHPMYYVSWYNRDPTALERFTQWGQTWANYQSPNSFADQVVIATGAKTGPTALPATANISPVTEFLGLYQVTGDPVWHNSFKMGIDGNGYSGTSPSYGRMTHGLLRWPEPYQTYLSNNFTGSDSGYAGFFLSKDRSKLDEWLNESASWYGRYSHMHTAAEQKTDRVLSYRATTPISCYLGDAPNRNRFYNFSAVSYEGLRGEDFAALVWDAGPEALKVAIFNFKNEPLKGVMRVWRLNHGWYRLRVGPDLNDDGTMDTPSSESLVELRRYDPVALNLPARDITIIELEATQTLDDIQERADLALSPFDTVIPGDGSAQIPIHNIGSQPATNIVVTLERNREIISTQTIANLAAPTNLVPQSAVVTFSAFQNGDVVVIDRAQEIDEVNEHNNRLVLDNVIEDTDGDGLPDWWETRHFQSPTAADATADTDLDGLDNLFEYSADTIPTNTQSTLAITKLEPASPTSVRITWRGGSNVAQRLYRGTVTSESPVTWTQIFHQSPQTETTNSYVDTPPPGDAAFYYYRVGITP